MVTEIKNIKTDTTKNITLHIIPSTLDITFALKATTFH